MRGGQAYKLVPYGTMTSFPGAWMETSGGGVEGVFPMAMANREGRWSESAEGKVVFLRRKSGR